MKEETRQQYALKEEEGIEKRIPLTPRTLERELRDIQIDYLTDLGGRHVSKQMNMAIIRKLRPLICNFLSENQPPEPEKEDVYRKGMAALAILYDRVGNEKKAVDARELASLTYVSLCCIGYFGGIKTK